MAAAADHRRTRAWRKLRASFVPRLPLPCGLCGQPVFASEPWDLHEPIRVVHGGRGEVVWPAHRLCNRRDGGEVRWAPPVIPAPSRAW